MSDADVLQMPTGAVGTSRTNRSLRLPSCLSSWPAQVIATFVIGLVSAAPAGLLLGKTVVVLLKSLELLAENKPIMDNLQHYILNYFDSDTGKFTSHGSRNDHVLNVFVSVSVEEFGIVLAGLSSVIGIFVGLSAYVLVIKRYGDAAMEKALTLAGTVCLMSITASGCILGLALETFLSIESTTLGVFCFLSLALFILICLLIYKCDLYLTFMFFFFYFPLMCLHILIMITIAMTILKTKLLLLFPLLPILTLSRFRHTSNILKNMAPLPLMLIITDVFNLAKQPIAAVQSSTNPNGDVVEGLFVGCIVTQLLVVVVGVTLFESWQRGGAAKICAAAAALGGAVLTVVESVLQRLGPGPTIGALMGVAGAAGVSLAAAGAVTHQYGDGVKFSLGKLGETVGVAVGAFAMSCLHSGLSSTFMVLFAATIPTGVCPELHDFYMRHRKSGVFILFLCIVTSMYLLLWLYVSCTNLFARIVSFCIFEIPLVYLCSCMKRL
ncbi:uncharacterized protein LOC133456578 [Cololabis saira]|uniref:uncharacterized protein LOC133456578 n=1 Tax=Cololabis saira TaxID=129043 RepID=UPI002AD4CD97|nr:uncharacterized protein LOC133456578 [Cololabis saira]